MGVTVYKRLFEVRVLHEFYLAQNDESSFFDLSKAEQDDKLNDLLIREAYDVTNDLNIEPTERCEQFLRNHRMKFILTTTGFFVAVEVEISEIGGQEVYLPVVPIGEKVNQWSFSLQNTNSKFKNFTNNPIHSSLPFRYLFTNDNSENNKTFPSLSLPAPVFQANGAYEMGSLVFIDDKLNQAIVKTNDPTTGWKELTQDHHWVSESDRILLPMQFVYTVSTQGIASVVFTLKEISGTEITQITSSDPSIAKRLDDSGNLIEVAPDFNSYESDEGDVKTLNSGFYQLEISETGGTDKSFKVYLDNELYMGPGLGGLIIYSTNTDPNARVIDEDGFLVRKADGSHPVFEIRLKNRITYWRYNSVASKKLEAKNKAADFLDETAADNFLVSKDPKPLQKVPLYFEDGADKVFLPNPSSSTIKPENDGKMYSDIFISEVKGLIENKN